MGFMSRYLGVMCFLRGGGRLAIVQIACQMSERKKEKRIVRAAALRRGEREGEQIG